MIDSLYCRVIGNGYPVVFLHGFLESITMWDSFKFPNAKCVYIDLPGHGLSTQEPSADITIENIANQVKEQIDKLQLKKYSVVGHSMGGYVGLELKKNDSRCESLVLLNSNFWNDNEKKIIDRRRISKLVKKNKRLFLYEAIPNLYYHPEKYNSEIKELISQAEGISSTTIANLSIALSKRNDFTDFVQLNYLDFEIIQGTFDSVVLRNQMVQKKGRVKYHELESSGHMSHVENEKNVQKIIEDFIKMKNGN